MPGVTIRRSMHDVANQVIIRLIEESQAEPAKENRLMRTQTHVSRILWYEGLGFLAIITLSWVDELSDLTRLVGAHQYTPNWRESALETLIVVLVAIPVMILTRKLVSRLYYLEGFLRVCAWCKKVNYNGKWVPLTEFLELRFQTKTSQGLCLICLEDAKADAASKLS